MMMIIDDAYYYYAIRGFLGMWDRHMHDDERMSDLKEEHGGTCRGRSSKDELFFYFCLFDVGLSLRYITILYSLNHAANDWAMDDDELAASHQSHADNLVKMYFLPSLPFPKLVILFCFIC